MKSDRWQSYLVRSCIWVWAENILLRLVSVPRTGGIAFYKTFAYSLNQKHNEGIPYLLPSIPLFKRCLTILILFLLFKRE